MSLQFLAMSYYCDPCNRYFKTYNSLCQHQETSSRHRIRCDDCNKEFSSQWGLTQHYTQSRRHHYCRFCDEHFDDDYDLEEHNDDEHACCSSCDQLFQTDEGLHQHRRQVHWYCGDCRRLFQSKQNLDMHLNTSAIHNPRKHVCPGRGCNRSFVAYGDLALHLESGACRSGFNRRNINNIVVRVDKKNVITNPSRLIGYRDDAPITRTRATGTSWNGHAYECVLCHKEFRQLSALNSHLESPAHEEKIYRCPAQYNGCSSEYRTLSALLSHVERSECGVTRFRKRVTNALDDITSRMKRIVT